MKKYRFFVLEFWRQFKIQIHQTRQKVHGMYIVVTKLNHVETDRRLLTDFYWRVDRTIFESQKAEKFTLPDLHSI